jgi:hypothetical protein
VAQLEALYEHEVNHKQKMQEEKEEMRRERMLEKEEGMEAGDMPEDEYVKIFKRLEEAVNRQNELEREVAKLKRVNVSQKVLLDG